MIAAYFLSRTLVPACSAYWLKPHAGHGHGGRRPWRGHGAGRDHGQAEPETFTINGNGDGRRLAAGCSARCSGPSPAGSE